MVGASQPSRITSRRGIGWPGRPTAESTFTERRPACYSKTVIAHVRRATSGEVALRNTHPFTHDHWAFAHNGTLPGFEEGVRAHLLDAMSPEHRTAIEGETDSEHVFRFLLSAIDRHPRMDFVDVVARALAEIVRWCEKVAGREKVGLNVLLTDGERLVGSRLGRSLFWVHRHGVFDCEICGFPHVQHDRDVDYRAVVIASEPLTHETWQEVPDGTVFTASEHAGLDAKPLMAVRTTEH